MGFWHKLANSIKSPTFIKEVYNETNGRAIKYLVLMFTLVFLIVAIPTLIKGFTAIDSLQTQFGENVPEFKMANGEFQFSGQQPYIDESNNQVLIIDTTGATDQSALDKYQMGTLITKTKFFNKQGSQTTSYNFADFKGLSFDKAKVQSWIPFLKMLLIFSLIFVFFSYLVVKFLGILIYALLALSLVRRKELFNYGKTLNIAIYASTLATFIQGIKTLAFSDMPSYLFLFIYAPIVIFYMIVGIRAIENEA